jgi:hypothetical protein
MAVDMEGTLDRLAAASPVMAEALTKVRAEWAPDPPPPMVATGALGQAIVTGIERATDDELARVAAVIDDVMEHAPERVKDAVATGLLEAAISATDMKHEGARFLAALGPRARHYCQDWDRYTGRQTPGVWEQK